MKTCIVTGVTGQDGAWLSQLLLSKGYKVFGGIRRNSHREFPRLKRLGIQDKINFVELELLDYSNIFNLIKEIKPDEFYNLAAQSFVGTSFKQPISTYMVDGIAVGYILDALKTVSPKTKFYQASSSEMIGKAIDIPFPKEIPFHPRSPYGIAKLFAHWTTINYRESYGMYCCSGILYNHESELRGPEFVTRKISMNVARRQMGIDEVLELGNLNAVRDWGYAKDYCQGIYQMMQLDSPEDFVLATGKAVSVREFVEYCFEVIKIEVGWEGKEENERGFNKKTGELLVKVNPEFYRPAEVDALIGDYSKAKERFDWEPKVDVKSLAELMVEGDIRFYIQNFLQN